MRRTWLFCIGVLLALIAVGCGTAESDSAIAGVEQTVRAYNDALIRGFETLDMNALNRTATQEQAEREYLLMAALGEGRLQMRSRLISIEFGDVAFPSDDAARVTTTEVWDYDHISLDTSETVRSERGVTYRLQYDLILQDGRWLVDEVTSLEDAAPAEDAADGDPSVQ